MSRNDYFEYEIELRNGKKSRSAVKELDAYISEEEKKYGGIIIDNGDEMATRCQPKIFRSLSDLRMSLKKDKAEKEEAYEYLKKSNKTMKNIIGKLQQEMKLCRDNIRTEFMNFENLDTERLLLINPKYFVTSPARGK